MEEGSGRGSGRVGSDFLSAIAGRVGSTFRRVGSGRVQEMWPVDNSVTHTRIDYVSPWWIPEPFAVSRLAIRDCVIIFHLILKFVLRISFPFFHFFLFLLEFAAVYPLS